ncbi:MAG TPA: hypothetical protein VD838_07030 [Anaeromyxobacteraceae bacterium]|nr:hypothetical protein [Anaeromyxobacteraceae bacterium]
MAAPPLDLAGTTVAAAGLAAGTLAALAALARALRRLARGRPRLARGVAAAAVLAAGAVELGRPFAGPLGADLLGGELPTAAWSSGVAAAGALVAAVLLAAAAAGRLSRLHRAAVALALAAGVAGWASLRAELGAPREPVARAATFEAACRSCHSVSGIRRHVDGLPLAAVEADLGRLERLRGRMPPLGGDAGERRALAAWLAALDGRDDVAAPPAPDRVARGRAVARRCDVCHDTIPLAPRVAGWTEGQAYDALGRLDRLDPAMPPFHGTEAERRDLAAWLAALGAGGTR